MNLAIFGLKPSLEEVIKSDNYADFVIGRVVREFKERYLVFTAGGEFDAEITGNLRYSAQSKTDFPAVGDWVACIPVDEQLAIIHSVLPRSSLLERQAVGKHGETQVIAANIDEALIVQSVDRNFNINRLERYLTICYATGIDATLVLTKTDLLVEDEITSFLEQLKGRGKTITVLPVSNVSMQGYPELNAHLKKGNTYCVLGSSGVGKSTLINNLMGQDYMKTSVISKSNQKGRHTTSHRELIVLEKGAILIDTPGMKELGITDKQEGLSMTFGTISELSKECRFSDCSHTNESGCAILLAVENGEIDHATYNNYLKMQREQEHFQLSVADKRKKDKEFGKMIKSVLKNNKREKY
ncbi:MAG: ribosome small subunit-dependent GTPase A [Bacteroidales bacterium]|nr:ribosome small subunit-dependent GTPase A [Bacteroidales bacterium]MCF8457544.1 ribosome small subunit-dependent GTPase A [Bacteroidales bacterium]